VLDGVSLDQLRTFIAADARKVAGNVELFKARAKSLAGGLEPELSVAVDVMFPGATFAAAVAAFQKEFPATLLRFDVESSAVIEPVVDGRCTVGVVGHGRSRRRNSPTNGCCRSVRHWSFRHSTRSQPAVGRFLQPCSPGTSTSYTSIRWMSREH
jgi:DNA-binding transcriptional LysR family regulator